MKDRGIIFTHSQLSLSLWQYQTLVEECGREEDVVTDEEEEERICKMHRCARLTVETS
jgi:hypothetical protein